MKKYLISEGGNFYKANLHCHSVISDGAWTPEQIKQRYMEQGYSVVAYTDHNKLVLHNDLTDESFLALNGIEYGVNNMEFGATMKLRKNCDIGMIALRPDVSVTYDMANEGFKLRYLPEVINELIDGGRKMGFFVTHNHPTWSREEYTDYIQYNNMNALEIVNYSCICGGFDEHNSKVYDDMLRRGKRLYCIACDDNHNPPHREDSFGGFTMIKANELKYKAITDALLNGNFYASEGPLIYSLWYEDGKVFVETSPVQKIFITKPGKNVGAVQSEDLVTYAPFNVDDDDAYFYVTVVDEKGRRAYTNAYFPDEFLKA